MVVNIRITAKQQRELDLPMTDREQGVSTTIKKLRTPILVHEIINFVQSLHIIAMQLPKIKLTYHKLCSFTIVEFLYNRHHWGKRAWPLLRGGINRGVLFFSVQKSGY